VSNIILFLNYTTSAQSHIEWPIKKTYFY